MRQWAQANNSLHEWLGYRRNYALGLHLSGLPLAVWWHIHVQICECHLQESLWFLPPILGRTRFTTLTVFRYNSSDAELSTAFTSEYYRIAGIARHPTSNDVYLEFLMEIHFRLSRLQYLCLKSIYNPQTYLWFCIQNYDDQFLYSCISCLVQLKWEHHQDEPLSTIVPRCLNDCSPAQ